VTGPVSPNNPPAPSRAEDSSATLRVLTYNVRHGQGVGGLPGNGRVAALIGRVEPDVVGLTEVWHVRGRYDQPRLIGELTGMEGRFGVAHRSLGREIGNAVLARGRVGEVRELALGGRHEGRACLLAEVEAAGKRLWFGVTHLSLHRSTRRIQIRTLAEQLPADEPLVLAGDFNAHVSELEPLADLLTFSDRPPKTFPSIAPLLALDHIGASRHLRLRSLSAPGSLASDHLPLLAEYDFDHSQP